MASPASPRRSRWKPRSDGVTVNCISPGYVWTTLVENQIPDTMKARGLTREQVMNDVLLAAQPTKRFVTPEEVAGAGAVPVPRRSGVDHRRQPQHGRRLDRGLGSRAMRSHSSLPRRLCAHRLRHDAPARGDDRRSRRSDWRAVATADDRDRLRDWRDAFVDGAGRGPRRRPWRRRSRARARCSSPTRRSAAAPIPNGDYRCRVIKLGAKAQGMLDYVAYPAFTCRDRARSGDVQGFAKLTGSQRPVGLIFPGDAMRQVFLGTLVLGDEQRAHAIWPRPRPRRRRLRRAHRPEPLADGAAAAAFRIADST